MELKEDFPNEEIQALYGIKTGVKEIFDGIKYLNIFILNHFRLSGYVSSCEFGQGRSASDRQFIYVNRRAVDLPKVC